MQGPGDRLPCPGMDPWRRSLALLLALAAPVAAQLSLTLGERRVLFLEPPEVGEQDGMLDTTLDATPELELGELTGSTLGAGYGVSILGAGDGLKARWDRYRLKTRLSPGPLRLMGKALRLAFALDAGAEIRFLRHFQGAGAAAAAPPILPTALASVDHLLAALGPGSMASLPVHAELLLQASVDTAVVGLPVRPGLFLKLRGDFQLNLLRLRGDRVRVRLFSLRARSWGAGVKAGFVWDAELVELLGEELKVVSELTLLKASFARARGQGMLFDATLDLADPQARDAFEWLVHRPVRVAVGDKSLVSAGFARIQDLAAGQEDLEPAARSVELHHCGLLDYAQDAWTLKLGNALMRWGRRDLTTVLEFRPGDPGATPVVLASSMATGKGSLWFGLRERKWLHESQVFAAREPGGLRTLLWALRYRVKDRRFSAEDQADLAGQVRAYLGPGVRLALPPPPDPPGKGKGELTLRLGRAALERLAGLGEPGLRQALASYAARLGPGALGWRELGGDPAPMATALARALARALDAPDEKALETLARLRAEHPAFEALGPGFLLHLLGARPDDPDFAARAVYKADPGTKVKLALGALETSPPEAVVPVLRFLETGVTDLQGEAAAAALEAAPPP